MARLEYFPLLHINFPRDINKMTYPLLAAVANATKDAAYFSSTNGSVDNIALPAFTNTFTGGKGHTPISVPQASSIDYLLGQNGQVAHNFRITAPNSWDIYVWSDDSQSSALYWMYASDKDFSSATKLQGSAGSEVTSALYISMEDGLVSVTWNGVSR